MGCVYSKAVGLPPTTSPKKTKDDQEPGRQAAGADDSHSNSKDADSESKGQHVSSHPILAGDGNVAPAGYRSSQGSSVLDVAGRGSLQHSHAGNSFEGVARAQSSDFFTASTPDVGGGGSRQPSIQLQPRSAEGSRHSSIQSTPQTVEESRQSSLQTPESTVEASEQLSMKNKGTTRGTFSKGITWKLSDRGSSDNAERPPLSCPAPSEPMAHNAMQEPDSPEAAQGPIDAVAWVDTGVFEELDGQHANDAWKEQKKRLSMHVAAIDQEDEAQAPSQAAKAFYDARKSIDARRASVSAVLPKLAPFRSRGSASSLVDLEAEPETDGQWNNAPPVNNTNPGTPPSHDGRKPGNRSLSGGSEQSSPPNSLDNFNVLQALKRRRASQTQPVAQSDLQQEGLTKAAREYHNVRASMESLPRSEHSSAGHALAQDINKQGSRAMSTSAVILSVEDSRASLLAELAERAQTMETVPKDLAVPLLLLSVLPLDTPAPASMLAKLWVEIVDPLAIAEVVEGLEMEGYVVSARPTDDSLWVLLDASVQESLQVAVEDMLPSIHSYLIDSYIPSDGKASDVHDDGYFMHNVAYHLAESGRMSELKDLLGDPFWLEEKLHSYGVASTVVDFRRYLMSNADPEVRFLLQAFQMSVGSCLSHIDACLLPAQMISRLLAAKNHYPGIAEAVALMQYQYNSGKYTGRRTTNLLQQSKKTRLLRKQPAGTDANFTSKRSSSIGKRISGVSIVSSRSSNASQASGKPVCCMVPITATLEQAGQGCRMTLRGHTGNITCMQLSHDALDLVTSSSDGSTCVWDTEIGDCVLLLEGDASVTCLALALNVGMVMTGTKQGTIQIWDLEGGNCKKVLRPHRAAVNCMKVAPNGSLVVSGSASGGVGVWALSSDKIMHHMMGHTSEVLNIDAVFNVPWTADRCQTITGSADFTARLWDLRSGKTRAVFEGHTGWILSVCLTPDGEIAVTGSNDHTCRIWDCSSFECLHVLSQHMGPVNSVAVSDEKLATASDDQTLKLWDIDTGECLRTMSGHNGWLNTVAIVGNTCIAAGCDCNVSVWDVETGNLTALLEGHSDEVLKCELSPDASVSVTISSDNSARVWDLAASNKTVNSVAIPRHSGRVNQLVLCRDNTAISAGEDGRAYVWDILSGTLKGVLDAHVAAIKWMQATSDGQHAITVSGDRMINTWNVSSSEPETTIPIERGSRVKSFAMSSDGKIGAIVLFDSSLSVLNLSSGDVIAMLQRRGDRNKDFVHSGGINGVILSDDGLLAVTFSKDCTARVWDVSVSCCTAVLEGHAEDVTCAALSLDERVVVTGSFDTTARVWDPATGACKALLTGHSREVQGVVLSMDGSMVVTLSGQTVRIWETETGALLYSLSHGLAEDVDSTPMASFNNEGTHLLTAVDDRANIWDMRTGTLAAVFVLDCGITTCLFAGPPQHSFGTIVVGDVNGNVHFATMPDDMRRKSLDIFAHARSPVAQSQQVTL